MMVYTSCSLQSCATIFILRNDFARYEHNHQTEKEYAII